MHLPAGPLWRPKGRQRSGFESPWRGGGGTTLRGRPPPQSSSSRRGGDLKVSTKIPACPAPKCPLIPAPGTFIHPSLKCLSIPPCTPPVTGLTRLGLPRPFAMDADLTVVSTTVAPAFVSALPPPSHRRRRHRCRHHRRRRRRRHRCRCRHRCRRTSSRRLLTATTTATLRPPPPSRRCRSR